MSRMLEEKHATILKEIRKQTTEIEFGLMYNAPEDEQDIASVDLFLKNSLVQLDAAKILINQL